MTAHDHAAQLAEALRACLERIETDYPDERDGRDQSPRNPGIVRDVKDATRAALAAWDKHNAPAPKQEALL